MSFLLFNSLFVVVLSSYNVTVSEFPFVSALILKSNKQVVCLASFCSPKHLITACSCVVNLEDRMSKKIVQLVPPQEYSILPGYNLKREIDVVSFREYPGCHYYPTADLWEHDFGFVEIQTHFEFFTNHENVIPSLSFRKSHQIDFVENYAKGNYQKCASVGYSKGPFLVHVMLFKREKCGRFHKDLICGGGNVTKGAPLICEGNVLGIASGSKKPFRFFTPFSQVLDQVGLLDTDISTAFMSKGGYLAIFALNANFLVK